MNNNPVPYGSIVWKSKLQTLTGPSINDLAIGSDISHYATGYFPSAATITGIVAPTTTGARVLWITNVSSNTLTLAHNSGSSAAGNRIIVSTGANLSVGQNETAQLIYDPNQTVLAYRVNG